MIRHVGVRLSLLFLLAGCRSQPYVNAHIESVNTEYRQLEDYVYCLEDENARLNQELDALQKGGPAATTRPGAGGAFRRRSAPETLPGTPAPADSPPTIELPGSSSPPSSSPGGRSSSQRPLLSPGEERGSPADTPPNITLPPMDALGAAPGATRTSATLPAEASSPDSAEPRKLIKPAALPVDTKVTRLFLNPLHTGGADLDGRPGEDGLLILLEPRNISDECVPEAGAVSIVVLDPAREGDAARLARWDFDAAAVKALHEAQPAQHGLKLELPWPGAAPTSPRLKLFVRYETADGRRLQTDREIFVNPPGQTPSRWTPRFAERPKP